MIIFPIITSLLSIGFAIFLISLTKKYPTGSGKQIEIWEAIKDGSRAYLRRQNMTVGVVAVILAIVLWYFFDGKMSLAFLVGAFASGLAGYLGRVT